MKARLLDGKYEAQPDLQRHMLGLGVTTDEVAKLWGDAPSTARGRLTGHSPITFKHKLKLASYLTRRRNEVSQEVEARR